MPRTASRLVLAAAICAALPAAARAEIAELTTGRTLSVASHSYHDDGTITLILRGGGEVTCAATLVARIAPDEVPYPEPEAATAVAASPDPGRLTGPYADLITRAAARQGLDPNLVHAVIRAESNYQPRARSARGARGLMQLMPATLRDYAVQDAYDPVTNIDAGTRHLRALLERFPLAEALAAYNAGIAAVIKYDGVPPFPETREYVARVIATLRSASRASGR